MEQQELREEEIREENEGAVRMETGEGQGEALAKEGESVQIEAEDFMQWVSGSPRCLNNAGVGVIEIILILVVLVALVLIFKEQLTSMVQRAMEALEQSMEKVLA